MISLDRVRAIKGALEDEHRDRHEAHRKLRDYWHGRYWQQAEQQSPGSVASIFRDMPTRGSSIGPDVKLVHNVLHEVCVKFQTFLSPLPMIRVPSDPPESQLNRNRAMLKERSLYGTWSETNMSRLVNKMGWYLPLMGDCFLGIFPDFDRNMPVATLQSPEYAYPIPSFDGFGPAGVIFCWKLRESAVIRQFPNYVPRQARPKGGLSLRRPKRGMDSDPEIEILEYSDEKQWGQWADDQYLNGIVHNFGFSLYEQVQFINVPDEAWGHGAVEQAVNLNEMGNALYSLLFQSVLENVFPRMVLIDPAKAPEQIDVGPGAVIPINAGGAVEWLHPPVQAIGSQIGFMQQNEQAIKQTAGMTDANFGVADNSIITGKAINYLQGAGAGNTVEMVQSHGVGAALEWWNEKALFMYQRLFRDDTVRLHGIMPTTAYDLNPRSFGLTFKGSQIVGSQQNELVFSPAVSMHEKIVMGLQMAGAGLVSKKWQRDQAGIPDSEAMDEEILGEVIQDAVLGAIVQSMQSEPTPEHAASAEDQAFAYLNGQTAPGPRDGTPLTRGEPAPQAALPPGNAPPGGGPPVPPGAPPAAPPQAPQQAPLEQPPASGSGQTVTLQQAGQAIQGVQGLAGKVFLVGEIVDRGQTDADIEIALTAPQDQQPITAALQQWADRLSFHTIQGDPVEPFLEVTPGSQPRQGGQQEAAQPAQPPSPLPAGA